MKNKLFWIVFLLVSSFSYKTYSGVRTLYMNESQMKNIYLNLGKSTVLSFNSIPKKAIVGNSNFFNIEFIKGTNDVSIQPLGKFNTNLFIYTENHAFGLLLKINQKRKYDDRVNIKWSSNPIVVQKKRRKSIKKKVDVSGKINLTVKKRLEISVQRIIDLERNKLFVLDLSLKNAHKEIIKLKDIKVSLTRSKKELSLKNIVRASEILKPGEATKIRIFFSLNEKRGFTINVSFKDKTAKAIVGRRFL